jgi:hypothetical protein
MLFFILLPDPFPARLFFDGVDDIDKSYQTFVSWQNTSYTTAELRAMGHIADHVDV